MCVRSLLREVTEIVSEDILAAGMFSGVLVPFV